MNKKILRKKIVQFHKDVNSNSEYKIGFNLGGDLANGTGPIKVGVSELKIYLTIKTDDKTSKIVKNITKSLDASLTIDDKIQNESDHFMLLTTIENTEVSYKIFLRKYGNTTNIPCL